MNFWTMLRGALILAVVAFFVVLIALILAEPSKMAKSADKPAAVQMEKGYTKTRGPLVSAVPILPPCASKDSDQCYWDAPNRGNGKGRSFYRLDGRTTYF